MKFFRFLIIPIIFLFFCTTDYTATPNTVIATIPVGTNPTGIAITPDNQYVYVANSDDTVSVISVATNQVITTIPGFDTPYSITINPAGTLAYVTNSGSGAGANTISIVPTITNTIIGTIAGLKGPDGMVITPDGKFGYVANYGFPFPFDPGNTVTVLDMNNNAILDQIVVDDFVSSVAISPDGTHVYATCYVDGNPGTGTFNIIDVATNTLVDTITGFSGPYSIAVTPDGKFAYVTNFGSNNFTPIGTTVSVVDLSQNIISDTIEVGNMPAGVAITPDGAFVYVTNYNDPNNIVGPGTVNIINAATNTVIEPVIDVEEGPGAIAITPDGVYAYVSNYIDNSVSVIALPFYEIIACARAKQNRFLFQKDLINKITWSVCGPSKPAYYQIFRDAELTDLVATISGAGPLKFLDHNRKPHTTYTYYLVGINAGGTMSAPVELCVTQC